MRQIKDGQTRKKEPTLATINKGYDYWTGKVQTPLGEMLGRDAEAVFTNLAKEGVRDVASLDISEKTPVATVNTGNAIHTISFRKQTTAQ